MGAGHLHPLNYALGLADAAIAAGASLYQSTIVESYIEGRPNRILTNRGVIEADSVVLACNGYLGKLEQRVAGKIMPINNFVIATEPLTDSQLNEINPRDVAIADSRFVVNYYRLSADKRLLFGGGAVQAPRIVGGVARECGPVQDAMMIDHVIRSPAV